MKNTNINKNKIYQSPKLDLIYISLEEGIANGSATIYVGFDESNEHQPEVSDWINSFNEPNNRFDM